VEKANAKEKKAKEIPIEKNIVFIIIFFLFLKSLVPR
jgi:hypothetical protein